MDEDPVLELAKSEVVETPDVIPAGPATVGFIAAGAGVGGMLAGAPGAAVGGALGWVAETLRRKLLRLRRPSGTLTP